MSNNSKSPNFFVIGVVKGGTTSLYHYLSQHPDIYLPSIKETNHFSFADIQHEHFLPEYALDVKIDLEKYISSGMTKQIHIAHVDDPGHYQKLFAPVTTERAIGEISNSYMISPHAAKAIHDYNPDGKILVILRNPITRAWSQYLMNLREAKSAESQFLKDLQDDADRTPRGWGVNHQYLELGKYSEQLSRYFDLFGRDRVCVLFYEEYRKNPDALLETICQFLGVDSTFEFDLATESNKASMPRSAVLNKFLIKSGMIKFAKELTPKSLRKYFAKALYSDNNIPHLSERDIDWLRNYYQEEVNSLERLLTKKVRSLWPEFQSGHNGTKQ